MSSDRAKRVATIVDEALAVSEGERASYIASACNGDEELAAEVADLISYRSKAEDPEFVLAETRLRSPGVPVSQLATADLNDDPTVSRGSIGPYRIVRVLGEGGMGIVYEAAQSEPVRRSVALKVIKPGMDSRAIIARFEAERQALAMMDHPGVAKVFDGGTTKDGRPYFAMELVRGDPITEHCTKNTPTPEETLTLFLAVCDAVQHAHAKGVIHRDLKPSNILVSYTDGKPSPKVIDFGIAKALHQRLAENTLVTALGQFIGTPEYMSPEQADPTAQDIDIRTDVYALGVVLYELLTGQRPFDSDTFRSGSFAEIQRVIREVDPPKPSTRLARLQQASSATDDRSNGVPFAPRQLRQDLDWIAIKCLAKSRDRRYQTTAALADDIRRFLRNEPVEAGPPTASYRVGKFVQRHRGPVVAAGLITTILIASTIGLSVLTRWALIERGRAASESATAQAALAAETQRSAELEQVAQFQSDQLQSVEPAELGRTFASGLLADIAQESTTEPAGTASFETPSPDLRAAVMQADLTGIALEALDAHFFEPSIKVINTQFAAQPVVQARLLRSIGSAMYEAGLFEKAEQTLRTAEQLYAEHRSPDDLDTLLCSSQRAAALHSLGQLDHAGAIRERVLNTLTATHSEDHPRSISAMTDLGSQRLAEARLSEASDILEDAVERGERVLGHAHETTLHALELLANAYGEIGSPESAEATHRRVRDGYLALQGERGREALIATANLGVAIAEQGRLDEAEPFYREALAGYADVYGDDHPDTLLMLGNLGYLLDAMGRDAEAESCYLESYERLQRVLGPDHPRTLGRALNLAGLLRMQKRNEEAEPYYTAAYEGYQRVLGPEHPSTLKAQSNLSLLLRRTGRIEESYQLANGALEKRRRVLGDDHPDTLISLYLVGYALRELGRYEESEVICLECERRNRSVYGDNHSETVDAINLLVSLYEAWGASAPSPELEAKAARWRDAAANAP